MTYLTRQDVAALLRVSVATVDRLRANGLPSSAIGHLVRFKREDVERWVEGQKVGNSEASPTKSKRSASGSRANATNSARGSEILRELEQRRRNSTRKPSPADAA